MVVTQHTQRDPIWSCVNLYFFQRYNIESPGLKYVQLYLNGIMVNHMDLEIHMISFYFLFTNYLEFVTIHSSPYVYQMCNIL